MLDNLVDTKPRAEFAAGRVAHLQGLIDYIENPDSSMTQSQQDRAASELLLAQNHLSTNY